MKKQPIKTKRCPLCGIVFYTRNSSQIYCNSLCRSKLKRNNSQLTFGAELRQSKMNKD